MFRRFVLFSLCTIGLFLQTIQAAERPADGNANKIVLIVMDPLSSQLACDCVKGYAQRNYDMLGEYLQQAINRPVEVAQAESLTTALKEKTDGRVDIIIGKDSVVRYGAQQHKLSVTPIASMTDLKGSTMQKGLFVVRTESPVASLLDITNFQVLFGPESCDEKYAAPRAKLKDLEIVYSEPAEACQTCSIAAKKLVALPTDSQTVAVISSYATPLLEGCGSVKKGDLRIIGESDEVPFISCFVNSQLPRDLREKIQTALLNMKSAELRKALETQDGFVSYMGPQE